MRSTHNEEIRQKIVSGDAGRPTDFPCVAMSCMGNAEEFTQLIYVSPIRSTNNNILYQLYLSGILFILSESSSDNVLPEYFRGNIFAEDGTLRIMNISAKMMMEFITFKMMMEFITLWQINDKFA